MLLPWEGYIGEASPVGVTGSFSLSKLDVSSENPPSKAQFSQIQFQLKPNSFIRILYSPLVSFQYIKLFNPI
jgi:hypothetical protein